MFLPCASQQQDVTPPCESIEKLVSYSRQVPYLEG